MFLFLMKGGGRQTVLFSNLLKFDGNDGHQTMLFPIFLIYLKGGGRQATLFYIYLSFLFLKGNLVVDENFKF